MNIVSSINITPVQIKLSWHHTIEIYHVYIPCMIFLHMNPSLVYITISCILFYIKVGIRSTSSKIEERVHSFSWYNNYINISFSLLFFFHSGNSKYHYYGIRVKPNSPLARLTDDTQVALRATPSTSKRSLSTTNYDEERRSDSTSGNDDGSSLSQHQQYLGEVGEGLPKGPAIDLVDALPDGVTNDDVVNFGNYYRNHSEVCIIIIMCVCNSLCRLFKSIT